MRHLLRSVLTCFVFGLASLLTVGDVLAEVRVTRPVDYEVIQRDNASRGRVLVEVAVPRGTRVVQVRLRKLAGATRGRDLDWKELTAPELKNGVVRGSITADAGGWYQLDVRALDGRFIVGKASVAHVGIGDVFVTAGQHNAANYAAKRQVAKSKNVVYFDGSRFSPARDPMPGVMGDMGNYWIGLGDLITQKTGLPVCFVGCAIEYTTIAQWLPTAKARGVAQYPNLIQKTRWFNPNGVRAVLWVHGPWDALAGTPAQKYHDQLIQVVRSARQDVGYPVDWFVAQESFHVRAGERVEKQVAEGQQMVWKGGEAYEGPNLDDLLGRQWRHNGAHFNAAGQAEMAKRWFEAISAKYGKSIDAPKRARRVVPPKKPRGRLPQL